MKKIIIPLIAAILLAGCGKEQNNDMAEAVINGGSVLNPIVFTSTASDKGTKVEIDGYSLKFSVEENIAVASYNFASETTPLQIDYATFDGAEASASGTFTPHTHAYGAEWAGAASAVSFYSYYPTTAEDPTISGTTATITNIGTSQNGTLSNIVCWAKGSHVATAAEVTAGNAPSFHYAPVCSLLKLTIVNNDDTNATSLSSITLTATSGNNIAGDASLNLLTGSFSGGSSKTITYRPASPLEIAKNGTQVIYLALIPNASITDWTLNITDSRGEHFLYETSWGDKDLPTALLPGRMYERTLTISSITGVSDLTPPYTYNGVKFVRGFLKRTTTDSTDASDMRISDATDDPLELLEYANKSITDSYNMFFSKTDINSIFGSPGTGSISISEQSYKVATESNLQGLYALADSRDSNVPTINGTQKTWSFLRVTLADSNYPEKGFLGNKSYIDGILYFPDGASVLCTDINKDKCEVQSASITESPNTVTTTTLKLLVNGGCLFIPLVGGENSGRNDWTSRGKNGYCRSATDTQTLVINNTDKYTHSTAGYNVDRHFPVALVYADAE